MSGDIDKADTYEVQAVASKADAADYDALIARGHAEEAEPRQRLDEFTGGCTQAPR